jgi:hypothetical protein
LAIERPKGRLAVETDDEVRLIESLQKACVVLLCALLLKR